MLGSQPHGGMEMLSVSTALFLTGYLVQCKLLGKNFWWILGQMFSGFLPCISQSQVVSTMGKGRREVGCGMKLPAPSTPIASPHSGVRRKLSLLKCSGEGLSAVEVSPAGRRGGEEGLPCLQDSGPVDSYISGTAVFRRSMPAKVHVKEG